MPGASIECGCRASTVDVRCSQVASASKKQGRSDVIEIDDEFALRTHGDIVWRRSTRPRPGPPARRTVAITSNGIKPTLSDPLSRVSAVFVKKW
jgi:hypothetical protein